MLRTIVVGLAGIAAAAGALLLITGNTGPGIPLLCMGGVTVLGTVFERWRYRNAPHPGAHWEPTGERFQDPSTGETMEVQYDRASGERRYVRGSGSPSGE